jgi:hypothetical protein
MARVDQRLEIPGTTANHLATASTFAILQLWRQPDYKTPFDSSIRCMMERNDDQGQGIRILSLGTPLVYAFAADAQLARTI